MAASDGYHRRRVPGDRDVEQSIGRSDSDAALLRATQASNNAPSTLWTRIADSTAFQVIINVTVAPFIISFIICSLCFCGDKSANPRRWFQVLDEEAEPDSQEPITRGRRGVKFLKYYECEWKEDRIRRLILITASRVGCVLLVLTLLSLLLLLLHLHVWKWFLLAMMLSLAYPFIFMHLNLYGKLLETVIPQVLTNNTLYYSKGLFDSVAMLLHVFFNFLLWMLYFHQQGGLASAADKYVTSTLAAALVGMFLWALKTAVLLRWTAKAIYTKFRGRFLIAAFRLFFLTCILDGTRVDTLIPWWTKESGLEQWLQEEPEHNDTVTSSSIQGLFARNGNIQTYILSRPVSWEEMKLITQYLINLVKLTPREESHRISGIIEAYKKKLEDCNYVKKENIQKILNTKEKDDEKLFEAELRAEYPSKEINQVPFDQWLVDAHKSCVSIGYTLIDAFAMVTVLDTILSCCLIVAVTLLWLLVTEIATTKVLVVIASPFLALTFVFGDTCKTFFQGFIFAFITHPFDIGDRCILDGIEVEVKRINIMTTTCLKIGTNEQLMYPNSMLATTRITNLGYKLDPKDVIELVLPSSTDISVISNLKKFLNLDEKSELHEKSVIKLRQKSTCEIREESHVKLHRESPGKLIYEDSPNVVVEEMNNGIKIYISFQHIMDGKDVSHSQFLVKKKIQRSKLLIEIKKFLDKLGVQIATS